MGEGIVVCHYNNYEFSNLFPKKERRVRAQIGLEPTNEFRNLPEQEKKQNMNVKKIVILSVISLLVAFSSCNTFKRPLKK